MAKNVLPKHWNGSEFEELHIVTKASNVFTNDNKSVQQKIDDFTSHLAESVVYGQSITRDISIEGVQTIALPFKAKKITAFACITSTNNESTGVYTDNNYQTCNAYRGYNNDYTGINSLIRLYSGSGNHITGTVQNVTDTGFEIFWEITGGSPTGTARVIIVAETH